MLRTLTIVTPALTEKGSECHSLTETGRVQVDQFAKLAIECRAPYDFVLADDHGCSTGRHIVEALDGHHHTHSCPPYQVVAGGGPHLAATLREYATAITHGLIIVVAETAIEAALSYFGERLSEDDQRRLRTIKTLAPLTGYQFHLHDGSVRLMKEVRWDTLIELEKLGNAA